MKRRRLYVPSNRVERVAVTGFFLALALALPPLFHLFGGGSVFLPMLLPVVTAGFLLDFRSAITIGGVAPLLSSALTGMPPIMPPIALMMVLELAVLGLVPSILYRRLGMNLHVVLILSLLINRVLVLMLRFIVAEVFNIPGMVYGLAVTLSGLPGMIIQIVVVPMVVRVIEERYGSYRTVPENDSADYSVL